MSIIAGAFNSNTAFDYSMFGSIDNQGNIKELWGGDAVRNSVLMWLASFQGEIIRDPERGGYLISLITKPMTDTRANDIRFEIKRGLLEDFSPLLQNVAVSVEADYVNRKWNILVQGWCEAIKETITVSQTLKNLV